MVSIYSCINWASSVFTRAFLAIFGITFTTSSVLCANAFFSEWHLPQFSWNKSFPLVSLAKVIFGFSAFALSASVCVGVISVYEAQPAKNNILNTRARFFILRITLFKCICFQHSKSHKLKIPAKLWRVFLVLLANGCLVHTVHATWHSAGHSSWFVFFFLSKYALSS